MVFWTILNQWRLQVHIIKPKSVDPPQDKMLLQSLNIYSTCSVGIHTKWISWSLPLEVFLKLNIDRASKGNPGSSGGGVVLRNHWGQLVLVGSYYYGHCSNMEAEMKALLSGLLLLHDNGLEVYPSIIESDSKILVDMITHRHIPSWKF